MWRGELNFGFRLSGCPVAHCRTEPPLPDSIHNRARQLGSNAVFGSLQDQGTVDVAVDANDKTHRQLHLVG